MNLMPQHELCQNKLDELFISICPDIVINCIAERKTTTSDIIKSIKGLKGDDGIFAHCKTILEKDYVYEIDGLVFTPINLAVGEEPNIRKRNQYSGRWHRSFKWKPQDLITIDFLVDVKKDSDGKPLISYGKHGGEMVPYQSLVLKVGYDPKQHCVVYIHLQKDSMLPYYFQHRHKAQSNVLHPDV